LIAIIFFPAIAPPDRLFGKLNKAFCPVSKLPDHLSFSPSKTIEQSASGPATQSEDK
jgi:hypothetical protein